MTSKEIILTFDEDIEPSSVNISGITIQGTAGLTTNTSLYYRLTYAQSVSVEMNTVVRVLLLDADFNALQIRLEVATSQLNTYLTMDPTTATDRSARRNMVQPIIAADAQQASTFDEDMLQPMLREFSLDLDAGEMSLTFSEPVFTSSFTPRHVLISSRRDSSVGTSYRLTGGRVTNSNIILATPVIELSLNFSNLVWLKVNPDIATTIDNTYLSVSSGLVADTNGNINSVSNGIRVSNLTPDTSPPELVSFDVDLDRGELVLTFSDVVNASSLNASAITVQNSRTDPSSLISLSSLSSTISSNGLVILVQLAPITLNLIKNFTSLCTARSNCFISVTSFVASDLNGLQTVPVSRDNALSAREFIADRTSPVLLSWELSLESESLMLTFDETVDKSTIIVTQLTLQSTSGVNNLTEAVTLTGSRDSYISWSHSPSVLFIGLTTNDVNNIKRHTSLGTEDRNSFITFSSRFIQDTSGNPVVPIPSSVAQSVRIFTGDRTAPQVVSFSINITSAVMNITFSEVVNIASLYFSGLTLVNGLQPSSSYTLTGGSLLSTSNDPVVTFVLIQSDLDSIIALGDLATSNTTTYLAATSRTVLDMAHNPLLPIPLNSALQVSAYYGSYGK